VKLIILIHVLPACKALFNSTFAVSHVVCPKQLQDPESLRNLSEVFGREGEGNEQPSAAA